MATTACLPGSTRQDLFKAALLAGKAEANPVWPAGQEDLDLLRSADELMQTRSSLDILLRDDARDTHDIPGFAALADRLAALTDTVCSTPAVGLAGVLAKARTVTPKDVAMRADAALSIAMSIAADLVAIEAAVRRDRSQMREIATEPIQRAGEPRG